MNSDECTDRLDLLTTLVKPSRFCPCCGGFRILRRLPQLSEAIDQLLTRRPKTLDILSDFRIVWVGLHGFTQ